MLKRGHCVGSELIQAGDASATITVCIDGAAYVGVWECSCGVSAERAFGHHIYSSLMDIARADCVEHFQAFHS
jgi:hypothetical protein